MIGRRRRACGGPKSPCAAVGSISRPRPDSPAYPNASLCRRRPESHRNPGLESGQATMGVSGCAARSFMTSRPVRMAGSESLSAQAPTEALAGSSGSLARSRCGCSQMSVGRPGALLRAAPSEPDERLSPHPAQASSPRSRASRSAVPSPSSALSRRSQCACMRRAFGLCDVPGLRIVTVAVALAETIRRSSHLRGVVVGDRRRRVWWARAGSSGGAAPVTISCGTILLQMWFPTALLIRSLWDRGCPPAVPQATCSRNVS